MTPADIDRVFGRGRLQMVTGDHVEVFREASLPGERRRYTKRFLTTPDGDFREWTEREWRILARLIGHGIKLRARRRAVRPRRRRPAGARADLRRRRHRRPLGDAAAGRARRRAAAPRVRGLRPLVGAGAGQPGRARRDPRAAPGPPRPQGRQRLHPGRSGRLRPARRRARAPSALRRHHADRLRVLAGLGRAPAKRACRSAGRPTTTTSRRDCCTRSRPAATATSRRRASSTGAATCTAWRRCSGAICPISTTPPTAPGPGRATPAHAPSCAA